MKRTWLSLLFGIIWCAATAASDFATAVVEATFKLVHPNGAATCFFIRGEAPDPALYLVTAAHVLERATNNTAVVVLRERRPDGSYQRRDHTITLRREGQPLWMRHPTEEAAVLRLSEPPPVPITALPFSALADESRLTAAGLHICSSVFVLTYPTQFEANKAGFPVARQGIVASHPFLPVTRHPTYLADFTTFDGDSGGPLFVRDEAGQPLVIGMVIAHIRHDERIGMEYEERVVHHPLGLGTVLHAQFVRDLIEQIAKQHVTGPK